MKRRTRKKDELVADIWNEGLLKAVYVGLDEFRERNHRQPSYIVFDKIVVGSGGVKALYGVDVIHSNVIIKTYDSPFILI